MKKYIIGVLVLLFAISIYVVAQPRKKQSAGDKLPLAAKIQFVLGRAKELEFENYPVQLVDGSTVMPVQ